MSTRARYDLPAATIVGIGSTEFSKNSGRSEQRLAVEAILAALEDAGLTTADVDGIVTLALDNTYEQALTRALGIDELTFCARTLGGGGGGAATIALASAAVGSGMAEVVVCFRALNERSQTRFGVPPASLDSAVPNTQLLDQSWSAPFGLATPAAAMAINAQRYLHHFGRTADDFGRVSVAHRQFAATNPAAHWYEHPITLEDHAQSRMIAEPLRLLDCCQESDGAVAIVVTSPERAADLRQRPVDILAGAMGIAGNHVGIAHVYREPAGYPVETEIVGNQLWKQSGCRPDDIDVAILYDHFSPAVLMQLEALGFCGQGEAGDLVAEGGIGIDGAIPVNPNGGQLGEAYIHGFNGIAEAVRQLRGTAVNQIADAERAVVTAASHVPTSGIVLGTR